MILDTAEIARRYGQHAANIVINSKRSVALAPPGAKWTAYEHAVATLARAVDSWLPKNCAVDAAQDIAVANGFFGRMPTEIQQTIAAAFAAKPEATSAVLSPSSKRKLITVRASDLKPEKLQWVWAGRIAAGKLVLIGGPPGLGKSLLTVFIASIISNGGDWPCGEGQAAVGSAIILSAEDGVRDTIIPRLDAAGANTEKVHIIEAKMDGGTRKTFNLKTDVDLLEQYAKQIGDVRVIIVDPISAYMGGKDGNNNVEVREVLEPLAEMANRLGIAVVAITHLNKGGSGGGKGALNRFAGSIAFVAAARAAFGVVEDAENPERRLLLQVKNNLGPACKGLAFRVEQRLIANDILAANVFFESEYVSHTADEALAASENPDRESGFTGEIVEFLEEALAGGPMTVSDLEHAARAAGLLDEDKRLRQVKSFRNARRKLGVTQRRVGFGAGASYELSLPGVMCAPKNHARPG